MMKLMYRIAVIVLLLSIHWYVVPKNVPVLPRAEEKVTVTAGTVCVEQDVMDQLIRDSLMWDEFNGQE